MKIKRLVIGTSNPGKVKEWKFFLKGVIPVVSVSEIGNYKSSEENEKTFLDNAIQKAKYYSKLTNEYVLSEDGGFEVDYLGGLPGIKSRRILPGNKDGTDEELIDFILKKLKGVSKEKRKAKITVFVVVADPEGKIIFKENNFIEGIITTKPSKKIEPGYPYRSILFLPKLGKYFIELTEEEHRKYAHRRLIADRLNKFLLKYN